MTTNPQVHDAQPREVRDAEDMFKKHQHFQQQLLTLSARFIGLADTEQHAEIGAALSLLRQFTAAAAVYLFNYDATETRMARYHTELSGDCRVNQNWQCSIAQALTRLPSNPHSDSEDVFRVRLSGAFVQLRGVWTGEPDDALLMPLRADAVCYGFLVLCYRAPWRFDEGEQSLMLTFRSLLLNLRKRMLSESRLQLAASVFVHSREAIMVTDADAVIIDVNEAFQRITGYSRDDVLGQNPRILASGRQSREFYSDMWNCLLKVGYWQGEVWNRRKGGEVFAEMLTISAVHDETGITRQYVALFSDVTTQKQHEMELAHLAHHDPLTGLPNRMLLGDRLRQLMAKADHRGRLLVLAYIDLDGFKSINDLRGHAFGDKVLQTLSQNMQGVLGEGDTLARLGGDEFVAVLSDQIDIQSSLLVVQRLLDSASMPLLIDDLSARLSASIGVTFYPQDEAIDADQLLRQADQAMYLAKVSGRNRFNLFDGEQDRHAKQRYEQMSRIQTALVRNEMVLFYQPKVNLRNGEVVGAEALIRWQDPERGLLPPAAFLPAIEDTPMAIVLGDWVLEHAIAQCARWRAQGWKLPVSINVGAAQLQQPEFVSRLAWLLRKYPDVEPGDIELEVLETSALDDFEQVSELMQACRELGVKFALDDFGSGYSSLTYLKKLPAERIKIDQSFVRDMLEDPEDLAILEGIMGLASALRRSVIAEGMETVEHGQMLLLLGCELAQGYGIARPMPAAALFDWAQLWQPHPAWQGVKSLRREDLPVLFTLVEFRAWMRAFEDLLDGKRHDLPPWTVSEGRFFLALDHWQDRNSEIYELIADLSIVFTEACALVHEIVWYHQEGDERMTLNKFEALGELYDQLLVPTRQLLGLVDV